MRAEIERLRTDNVRLTYQFSTLQCITLFLRALYTYLAVILIKEMHMTGWQAVFSCPPPRAHAADHYLVLL